MFGVLKTVLVLFAFEQTAKSANILGVFTCLSPSHLIVELSMMQVLAENGHNVTIVTSLSPPITHKDFNVIHVPLNGEEEQLMSATYLEMSQVANQNIVSLIWLSMKAMRFVYTKMFDTLNDARVKDLYESKDNKFDLFFCGYFMNIHELGLAYKLKVPIILSLPAQPFDFVGFLIGNPRELSYVPTVNVAVQRGQVMSFSQRLHNFCMSWLIRMFSIKQHNDNKRKYDLLYGHDLGMPKYEELSKNISLIFFNSHSLSEGPIRPNLPGIIEIGGIQIKDQPNNLPNDITSFLNNSKHGAILFSLGTNVRSSHLSHKIVRSLFNVLSELKQNVIWKWDNLENTPGNSSNIMYSKWLPQDDILAHPNVKLFITHAGKGSVVESQYHGKPMLALPVFADQPHNALVMVNLGFGLSLEMFKFKESLFKESLNEVLGNSKYTKNVETFSRLYRDRPLTARQTVLYWTEYVLRYQGAKHLQSPVVHMSFIEANNLDLFALFLSVLIILLWLFKKLFKRSVNIRKEKQS